MFARYLAVFSVAAAGLMSGQAQAATYSFSCLSNTLAANCADGEATLVMDVTDAGNNQVDFIFHNFSNLGSIISEVYFDDGTLLGIASLMDSGDNVAFTTQNVTPGNLPSGQNATPPFVTTQGFAADSQPNANKAGVHNAIDSVKVGSVTTPTEQEFLTVRFNLLNGYSYTDTIMALDGDLTGSQGEPLLRVGLHVVSYDTNNLSESFVNLPNSTTPPIPEADTFALMLTGLGLVGLVGLRKGRAGLDKRIAG